MGFGSCSKMEVVSFNSIAETILTEKITENIKNTHNIIFILSIKIMKRGYFNKYPHYIN